MFETPLRKGEQTRERLGRNPRPSLPYNLFYVSLPFV